MYGLYFYAISCALVHICLIISFSTHISTFQDLFAPVLWTIWPSNFSHNVLFLNISSHNLDIRGYVVDSVKPLSANIAIFFYSSNQRLNMIFGILRGINHAWLWKCRKTWLKCILYYNYVFFLQIRVPGTLMFFFGKTLL